VVELEDLDNRRGKASLKPILARGGLILDDAKSRQVLASITRTRAYIASRTAACSGGIAMHGKATA